MGRVAFNTVLKDTPSSGLLMIPACCSPRFSVPDPVYGYTTDDNARALMALMLYERYGNSKHLNLVYKYSSFILNAQNNNGKFRNFLSYNRKWLDEERVGGLFWQMHLGHMLCPFG